MERHLDIDFDLELLRASSPHESASVLRERLAEDGYLWLRGLHDVQVVQAAREALLRFHDQQGKLSDADPLAPRGRGAGYHGNRVMTHDPDFLAMVESDRLFAFFDGIFDEPSLTFDWKWIRVVEQGKTGAHLDRVYMGRGSERLLTCWTPIGDVPMENGPLMLLAESHRHPALQRVRETYGKSDVDRDHTQGWFTNDHRELSALTGTPWLSADMVAGDVLVFGMDMMHGSLPNSTGILRLSSDIRFQPAADPADERWVGEKPKGHYAWTTSELVPISDSRATWGV